MNSPAPKDKLGRIDPHIAEALELGGNADKILAFYEGWAEDYDFDVGALGDDYQATATMVSFFSNLDLDGLGVGGTDITILDAGCGTGLVGVALASAGYTTIDGIDLSPRMVEQANRRGVYRELVGRRLRLWSFHAGPRATRTGRIMCRVGPAGRPSRHHDSQGILRWVRLPGPH